MKGPKLTTKTSKPIDFIGDSRQRSRQNCKIVHLAMRRRFDRCFLACLGNRPDKFFFKRHKRYRIESAGNAAIIAVELVTIATAHTNVIAGEMRLFCHFPRLCGTTGQAARTGQFLTPSPVAEFMASLFEIHRNEVHLLDAGAGAGSLSAALVGRLCHEPRKPKRISITAYEVDAAQIESLRATLDDCRRECEQVGISFSATVLNEDFIAAAVPMVRNDFFGSKPLPFNVAIINPPYRKIRGDSSTRLLLRSADIEASNLYAGFVALVIRLLVNGGELVAITPRSFCNGPYFKPFGKTFWKRCRCDGSISSRHVPPRSAETRYCRKTSSFTQSKAQPSLSVSSSRPAAVNPPAR